MRLVENLKAPWCWPAGWSGGGRGRANVGKVLLKMQNTREVPSFSQELTRETELK